MENPGITIHKIDKRQKHLLSFTYCLSLSKQEIDNLPFILYRHQYFSQYFDQPNKAAIGAFNEQQQLIGYLLTETNQEQKALKINELTVDRDFDSNIVIESFIKYLSVFIRKNKLRLSESDQSLMTSNQSLRDATVLNNINPQISDQ